jgi:hypothetical protein
MSHVFLMSELVGGPFDGKVWPLDEQAAECRKLCFGAAAPDGKSLLWVEYVLQKTRLTGSRNRRFVFACYGFAGYRHAYRSRFAQLLALVNRWRATARRWVEQTRRRVRFLRGQHQSVPTDASSTSHCGATTPP